MGALMLRSVFVYNTVALNYLMVHLTLPGKLFVLGVKFSYSLVCSDVGGCEEFSLKMDTNQVS
jgi:hypothetical protein